MELSALKDILKNGGIVGAGGAGFPSYAKLDKRADTIVLNCAECEPLFNLHRQLLAKFAREILTALEEVRKAVEAERVVIAVKPTYTNAIDAVKFYLPEFKNTTISLLPEIYPAGDEIVTIYETTGRIVKPGNLPISVGVTVYNVETMLNAYYAIKEGKGITHKYVVVAGEVKHPVMLRVPLGMKYKDVVALAGGETVKDYAYLNGGVMTGFLATDNNVITKTSNAILVFPSDHQVILKRRTKTQISIARAMSTCCQCRSCTDLCSRHTLGYPIESHKFMRAVSKGMDSDASAVLNSMFCSQCGLCELYACPQGLSPRTLIGVAKAELRKNGVKPEIPEFPGVDPDRDYKRVPMHRLLARLGLTQYNVGADFVEEDLKPQEVKILMSQHIGPPCTPTVKVGDTVNAGDVVGTPGDKLGACIHASISGKVSAVADGYIIIKR